MKVSEPLLDISRALLAIPFAGQGFLGPLFLARFQVEGVPLDLLDDVFLLHFPLEPAKGAFQSFALLDMDFRQTNLTSLL